MSTPKRPILRTKTSPRVEVYVLTIRQTYILDILLSTLIIAGNMKYIVILSALLTITVESELSLPRTIMIVMIDLLTNHSGKITSSMCRTFFMVTLVVLERYNLVAKNHLCYYSHLRGFCVVVFLFFFCFYHVIKVLRDFVAVFHSETFRKVPQLTLDIMSLIRTSVRITIQISRDAILIKLRSQALLSSLANIAFLIRHFTFLSPNHKITFIHTTLHHYPCILVFFYKLSQQLSLNTVILSDPRKRRVKKRRCCFVSGTTRTPGRHLKICVSLKRRLKNVFL